MTANVQVKKPRKMPAGNSEMRLLRAFAVLVQSRPYDEITVEDIARQAQVGRSTFYWHFRGKEGLLTKSIKGPFSVLADSIRSGANMDDLIQLLEHFWVNRALARGLFLGPVRQRTISVLVALVETRIRTNAHSMPGQLLIAQRLVAIQIAELLLAPVTAWLTGESRCTAQALAKALMRTSRAVLAASYGR